MEFPNAYLQGLALGFSIAAPVGPVGVLCIKRTLEKGFRSGLLSGLGAASADAIYGCLAGFGLAFLADYLLDWQLPLRIVGGGFLLYLGLRAFFAQPAQAAKAEEKIGLLGDYLSTLLLTLTNPMTIIAFTAVLVGLGVGSQPGSYGQAAALVAGVFSGSALWWLVLSGIVALLRGRVTATMYGWINKLAGLVIAGFGLGILVTVLQTML